MRLVENWRYETPVNPGWERYAPILWSEFEPQPGVYDFARLEAMLARGSGPIHLGLVYYMNDLIAHVPADLRRGSVLYMQRDGYAAEMPDWSSTVFRERLAAAHAALATWARPRTDIASLWLSLGVDQETLACKERDGVDWPAVARGLMPAEAYYDFIRGTVEAARLAWKPRPVYLQGSCAPGQTWHESGRGIIKEAINYGVWYKGNHLDWPDRADAFGTGTRIGWGVYDVARWAQGCAFEPAAYASGRTVEDAYLMLLRALHWDVDFVACDSSWVPLFQQARAWLPAEGTDWLVFRQQEAPAIPYTPEYGTSGEPGCWGTMRYRGPVLLDASRQNRGRWLGHGDGTLQIEVERPDGDYEAVLWKAAGNKPATITVRDGAFTIPVGEWHRIDLLPAAEPPVDEDEAERVWELLTVGGLAAKYANPLDGLEQAYAYVEAYREAYGQH